MNDHKQTYRRGRIRGLLAQSGTLGVEEMARRFGVTTMTIRRDLAAMESAGEVLRTHGGCVLQAPMVREASFGEKIRRNGQQKAAIAREAVSWIEDGMTVYLDTGTTALHVARQMPRELSVRVCTNNLRVAMELFGRRGAGVVVLGGSLAERSPDLVGPIPARALDRIRIDVAMLGTDAVDPDRCEIYAADLPTAELSRAARSRAARCLVLADSSKMHGRGMASTARLGKGMVLLTDDGVSRKDLRGLKKSGARVVVAAV